jgi:hypothetical protein
MSGVAALGVGIHVNVASGRTLPAFTPTFAALIGYWLVDLARARSVRYLPKALSDSSSCSPARGLGSLGYLVFGTDRSEHHDSDATCEANSFGADRVWPTGAADDHAHGLSDVTAGERGRARRREQVGRSARCPCNVAFGIAGLCLEAHPPEPLDPQPSQFRYQRHGEPAMGAPRTRRR